MAILSIQSHVSYGHAGNSASVFPLMRLGVEVWPVHTVCFAHHTGYGEPKGHVFTGDDVKQIIDGVKSVANINECHAVMTGYLGAGSIGREILSELKQLRELNPDMIYSCDPVMGDIEKGFFTTKDVQDFFKNDLLDHFDILTPNLFELEQLSNTNITSIDGAIKAAKSLISRDDQLVVVTSFQTEKENLSVLLISNNECLSVTTPEIQLNRAAVGTGDLFHSLFLGNYINSKDTKSSLEKAVNSTFDIINITKKSGSYELEIVANQELLVTPISRYEAIVI